jgi:hypothetical protein
MQFFSVKLSDNMKAKSFTKSSKVSRHGWDDVIFLTIYSVMFVLRL